MKGILVNQRSPVGVELFTHKSTFRGFVLYGLGAELEFRLAKKNTYKKTKTVAYLRPKWPNSIPYL